MVRTLFMLAAALLAGRPAAGAANARPPETESSAKALRELCAWLALPQTERPALSNAGFGSVPLTRTDAAAATAALWQDHAAFIRLNRAAEMGAKVVELGGLKMKFEMLTFNDTNAAPTNGRSLFLSLHGGGGAPTSVNDSQWRNQVRLGKGYRPREGIYVAPRAPTDAWNLWHQGHIDTFFDRLIENLVVLSNVNPNRVYVFGYSAGGDGVYQLGPRMADRWAAAAMMAGHPNEASPLGLRNVPFAIQVGANDAGFNRNKVAAEWGRKLDDLQRADPKGYVHFTELHAGKGHWMDLDDRKAIPWMEKFTRVPLPDRVVWHQDDVTHTRFYWLARPKDEVKRSQDLVAQRTGQTVSLSSTNAHTVTVRLNDAMLNLDQPVVIRSGESALFEGCLPRTVDTLARTLNERGDPSLTFSAEVTVTLP
jgi:poly(3-hydroxybutyrate) depolymerase